jgi:hypothetical protein
MDEPYDKQCIENQLARCRDLVKEFPDGLTAQHLRELEKELQQKLRSAKQSR